MWGADVFSNSSWDIAQLVEMDAWIPSPTWIWSRFRFNEMNLLSGVDFIFALHVMGDFYMDLTYWRQRPVSSA